MARYDYKCPKCEVCIELEIYDDLIVCPKCGYKFMTRLFPTKTSFHLKGSGFHKNDYGVKND